MNLRLGVQRIMRRRAHLLLAILNAFTLIVGVVAVGYYLIIFPPSFRGWSEITTYNSIAGWAVNEAAPMANVEVQLYIDGRFIANKTADLARPDVLAAGRSKHERCGFNFDLPPLASGEHEAEVYAAHKVGAGTYRTLQRLGNPVRFKTP